MKLPPPPHIADMMRQAPAPPAPTASDKQKERSIDSVRDELGRWRAGRSGNPNGRPAAMAELRRLARGFTELGLWRLIKIIQDDEIAPQVQVQAVSLLFDRGYGRAVQPIEAGLPGDFENMEDTELRAYVKRKAAVIMGALDVEHSSDT